MLIMQIYVYLIPVMAVVQAGLSVDMIVFLFMHKIDAMLFKFFRILNEFHTFFQVSPQIPDFFIAFELWKAYFIEHTLNDLVCNIKLKLFAGNAGSSYAFSPFGPEILDFHIQIAESIGLSVLSLWIEVFNLNIHILLNGFISKVNSLHMYV